jgi:hypothetical protein
MRVESFLFFLIFVEESFSFETPDNEEVEIEYTNEWLVRLRDRLEADRIALENGYTVKKEITNFPNTYVFQREGHHRSRRGSEELTSNLTKDTRVEWAEQQVIRRRVKRNRGSMTPPAVFVPDPYARGSFPPLLPRTKRRFNDELWSYQWYVRKTANIPNLPLLDLNIEQAWDMGFTGEGIVVTVVDDGKELPAKLLPT